MNREQARQLVRETFTNSFDRDRYRRFIRELVNRYDESKASNWNSQFIKDAFKPHVQRYERLGTYSTPNDEKIDILVVYLTQDSKLERARTALRDFVADHLKTRDEKDCSLVAFVSPSEESWRFSLVKMEYETKVDEKGKVGVSTSLTPAKRSSYLVGAHEQCHTAQSRFLSLLQNTSDSPSLTEIEEAFSVETVTKEFFGEYARLFEDTEKELSLAVERNPQVKADFDAKSVSTVDLAKKLLGQIVFLYFIQKKGWLGVPKGMQWGEGPRDFLRQTVTTAIGEHKRLFDDVLEPLFYDTLATDRGHDAWCATFRSRIPFLNGGLFEPLAGYAWKETEINLPNSLFTNEIESGDFRGTGILDVFDRYNFTVNESEPLEKEVAIDPEMLGKVFENLIEDNRRKGLGAFYTPREIVHYMCQESLVNFLDTKLNVADQVVAREDLDTLIRQGEQAAHYEAARRDGTTSYERRLPEAVEANAKAIDEALKSITVCDPAVGSGAFPVGMMTEIVRARTTLTPYFNDIVERTPYYFKRHAIQNSLYGVDIDAGAVEIAKLRLWLSLVVDEEDVQQIKPLPNLDYKMVVGNSLFEVRKNLLNQQEFDELEDLIPRHFNESDRLTKASYKLKIDKLICELTGGASSFDFAVQFSTVMNSQSGFDIIIANPPYGADIDAELDVLRPLYRDAIQNYAEIYKMFFQMGLRKIKRRGTLVFITPNTFLSQPRYKDIRKVLLSERILRIVNLGEGVFEGVVVPTCVTFIACDRSAPTFNFADLRTKSKFSGDMMSISFTSADINQIKSSKDLSLYVDKPLEVNQVSFETALEIKDAGIQYHRSGIGLKNKGGNDLYERLFNSDQHAFTDSMPVWYGKLIDRWWIQSRTDEFFNLGFRKSLREKESTSFNQGAFETRPKILWRQTASCLRATIDTDGRWFRNTIQCAYIRDAFKERIDIYYLLGIINSRYIERAYNELVQEAGRVFPQVKLTHVKKLPLVIAEPDKQAEIASLVKRVIQEKRNDPKADVSKIEMELDRLIDSLYTSEDTSK